MPLPKQYHTSKDYWNLPEGQRAELIDGTLYDMAPPSYRHQFLIAKLSFVIQEYIFSHAGNCQLLMAPFAVNLDADDKNWVEPDISVICDRNKLHDHGCFGAPIICLCLSNRYGRQEYGERRLRAEKGGGMLIAERSITMRESLL